jgi:hypothetical protein
VAADPAIVKRGSRVARRIEKGIAAGAKRVVLLREDYDALRVYLADEHGLDDDHRGLTYGKVSIEQNRYE